ncbi:Ig-like domain-containing protein [Nocardioides sp.]|uniref:Ig-like domain-containing protein n=1 Tax=Nocardioides sp. TaxID=35761 RepID=UPI003515F0D0
MSVLTPHRRRRLAVGVLVGTVVGAVATTSALVAAPAAQAAAPTGSVYELFLEPGPVTGDPANAITVGKWGHEGNNRDLGTGISADLGSDASGAAMLEAFGTDDFNKLAVVFTTTSADGSNEAPTVEAGQNIGEVYPWFTEISALTTIAGTPNTPTTDEVLKVSTLAEYQAWINDGRPDQLINTTDFVSRDALRAGNPVSVAPKGKSILNRWAADQEISMVLVKTTGATDADTGLPIVDRNEDGKATAAWLTFRTGLDASVGNGTLATSGAYTVTSALTTPVVELTNGTVGATTTLTATIKNESGTALTDAAGSVQFSALPKGQNEGEFTDLGEPVAVSEAGTATFEVSDLAAGEFRRYRAVYTPSGEAAGRYASATSNLRTVTRAAAATTTSLTVTGTRVAGARQTLSATVAAGDTVPTGSIRFLDGSAVLATVPLAAGSATATRIAALTAGAHSLRAQFVPATSAFATSTSATSAVTIARARALVSAKVSPTSVRVRTKPKLAITVKATGLVPTGKVTVKVVAPGKRAVSVVGTLRNGVVTVTLPAAVKGTTKLTVTYGGSTSVLPATVAASYKAR